MFKPPEKAVTVNDRAFTLRRPGRGGIARIPAHIARALAAGGMFPDVVEQMDGDGVRMEAVLREYLVACPDDWKAKNQPDGAPRPLLDFENVDPAEFEEVGRAALAFHDTFRDVDTRFRAQDRKG